MSMLFKRIKDWATSITAFRTGDVIPVDGPSGTAKMSKDALLRVTAENAVGSIHLLGDTATESDLVSGNYLALDGSDGTKKLDVSFLFRRKGLLHSGDYNNDLDNLPSNTAFSCTNDSVGSNFSHRPSTATQFTIYTISSQNDVDNVLKLQLCSTIGGDVYIRTKWSSWFGWFRLNGPGSKIIVAVNPDVSSAPYNDANTFPINSVVLLATSSASSVLHKPVNEQCSIVTIGAADGHQMQLCSTYSKRFYVRSNWGTWSGWSQISGLDSRLSDVEDKMDDVEDKMDDVFGVESKTIEVAVTSGSASMRFTLLNGSLPVGTLVKVKLNESVPCVTKFTLGCFANADDTGSWVRMSDKYVDADGEWHIMKIERTNPSGHFGWYINANEVTANGTISMSVIINYEDSELYKIDESVETIENELYPKVSKATFNVTAGSNAYNFTLFRKALSVGDEVKARIVEGSAVIGNFALGCFANADDTGSWVRMTDYAPADGEWHILKINNANPSGRFGSWISGSTISTGGKIDFEVQLNYEDTIRQELDKDEQDIANLKNGALAKQFDGILKTSEDAPLTSVSQSDGLAGIFPKFGFIGDSLCSGAVAYNDGSWLYPERYYTSWGLYMCRKIGSNGTIWAYSGCTTAAWWNSYITLNTRGYNNEGVQDDNERFSSKKIGYVIALGTNDANNSVSVGDVDTDIDMSDYNNNADTFAGRYARIIQKIKELQPSAKIFVVTLPAIWQSQAESLGYNDVIRAMATKFTNVFVVDFQKYLPSGTKVSSDYVYQGHMTTQGYKWIAMAMATYIDYIVRTTPASFKNVALIGHTSDHGQY